MLDPPDTKTPKQTFKPEYAKVKKLLDELKKDGLLTREFAELYLHSLLEIRWSFVTDPLWDLCVERLEIKNLNEDDFWF